LTHGTNPATLILKVFASLAAPPHPETTMLKRQRASSPTPWTIEPTFEAEIAPGDLYEPDHKRRRYFTPSHLDKSLFSETTGYDSDSNLGAFHALPLRRAAGYSRGASEWQQHAGEYRDANTLLHDLHAEQRHRTIFSIRPSKHVGLQVPSPTHGSPPDPNREGECSNCLTSAGSNAQRLPSDATSQSWQPPVVEAKRVAHRYEDTNK
jgi:hypothetical protein